MASQKRNTLIKPGYHLRPKYDLHGLRERRTNEQKNHIATELPLTSMIDMFSILVIYLLMNFSATGDIFFINKQLALPKASSTNPLKTGPLISLVGEGFVLNLPKEYEREGGGEIGDSDLNLPNITATLTQLKAANQGNPDLENRVNIQAGEETPIGDVKKAMAASMRAGWTNINFVVEKKK